MASKTTLVDGNFTKAEIVGPRRYTFPFRSLGDRASCFFEEDYWQLEATWTPQELGTEHTEIRGFYLVAETDRRPIMADIVSFTRRYSRVPGNQITYGSSTLNKPTIPNEATTTASIRSPDAASSEIATAVRNNTGFWSTTNKLYAPFVAGTSAFAASPTATAGTFTLTYKTSTTGAIAYNAVAATINAAVNGLADVITDGLTYSATNVLTSSATGYLQLQLTAGTTSTLVTMNAASLTVSAVGAKTTIPYFSSSTIQIIQLGIPISAASHGYTNDAELFVLTDYTGVGSGQVAAYVFPVGRWDVYDANTLVVSNYWNVAATIATHVARYKRAYTPGATTQSSRITDRFYLPGITAGVSSVADIPLQSPSLADTSIIAAVLAGGAYTVTGFDGPTQWLGSSIWTTRTTEINFSNIT